MAHVIGQEQELLSQGREIGKEEGLIQGKAEQARTLLLRLGRRRFGEPDAATVAVLEALADLPRLERMSDAILDVPSWADLLATP